MIYPWLIAGAIFFILGAILTTVFSVLEVKDRDNKIKTYAYPTMIGIGAFFLLLGFVLLIVWLVLLLLKASKNMATRKDVSRKEAFTQLLEDLKLQLNSSNKNA